MLARLNSYWYPKQGGCEFSPIRISTSKSGFHKSSDSLFESSKVTNPPKPMVSPCRHAIHSFTTFIFACHIQSNMRSEFHKVIGCTSGIIPTSCKGIIISYYKLQASQEPISIMECHNRFERCSLASMNIPERKIKRNNVNNIQNLLLKLCPRCPHGQAFVLVVRRTWTGSQAGERASAEAWILGRVHVAAKLGRHQPVIFI